jgi:hypothetical protein
MCRVRWLHITTMVPHCSTMATGVIMVLSMIAVVSGTVSSQLESVAPHNVQSSLVAHYHMVTRYSTMATGAIMVISMAVVSGVVAARASCFFFPVLGMS